MKISEMITNRYKLRIPPTVYYELLADVREVEEEQEPRKGKWLGDSAGYKCNICGHDLLEIAHSIDYIDFKKPNYCPNCGAKMAESEEA